MAPAEVIAARQRNCTKWYLDRLELNRRKFSGGNFKFLSYSEEFLKQHTLNETIRESGYTEPFVRETIDLYYTLKGIQDE